MRTDLKELLSNPILNLADCTLCPRECHKNRLSGQLGYCNMPAQLKAARAALHLWEEPCISGERGSGAVFFSGCNMHCIFCQNHQIANGQNGKFISPEQLAERFLMLQEKGAHNINLVTPTHYFPQIIKALYRAKDEGLLIPVVYNTSSYEKVEALQCLEGLIDIYLPDLKYKSSALSAKYSNAPDYFDIASAAITEMVRQTGVPVFENGEESMIKRGVIVRHLVLPGCVKDSQSILKYLHDTYQNKIYISIMNQYTPMPQIDKFPELNRPVTKREYERVIDYAVSIGIENGFIQDGCTVSNSFIPPFDQEGI